MTKRNKNSTQKQRNDKKKQKTNNAQLQLQLQPTSRHHNMSSTKWPGNYNFTAFSDLQTASATTDFSSSNCDNPQPFMSWHGTIPKQYMQQKRRSNQTEIDLTSHHTSLI